ncbi:MAG: hypothetical protein K8I60_08160, partial [Anaerolineae bacterium]|nr:hypothetical protein [Anaerolineae bacterium]
MNLPQTGRTPIPLSPEETTKLLKKRRKEDLTDYFATDPNPDIRQLGQLALRRTDVNDHFVLGDMCARRSLTDDGRLLVFYVGKTLIAYQRAREASQNEVDRIQAERIIQEFITWTTAAAREHRSRRNIAVALWALAEYEHESDTVQSVPSHITHELLDMYQDETPTGPIQTPDEEPVTGDDPQDDFTLLDVDDDLPQLNLSDTAATQADQEVDDKLLSPDADLMPPSETQMQPVALDSLTSAERENV